MVEHHIKVKSLRAGLKCTPVHKVYSTLQPPQSKTFDRTGMGEQLKSNLAAITASLHVIHVIILSSLLHLCYLGSHMF